MIEIVRAKALKARQPWHVRVVAEGNSEPILAGETLTEESKAHNTIEALGVLFSPVGKASYAAGVLSVWLDEDEHGEKLHIPVEHVDEREPESDQAPETEPKPARQRGAARKSAASEGGDA